MYFVELNFVHSVLFWPRGNFPFHSCITTDNRFTSKQKTKFQVYGMTFIRQVTLCKFKSLEKKIKIKAWNSTWKNVREKFTTEKNNFDYIYFVNCLKFLPLSPGNLFYKQTITQTGGRQGFKQHLELTEAIRQFTIVYLRAHWNPDSCSNRN